MTIIKIAATALLVIAMAGVVAVRAQSTCKVGVQAPPAGFWAWEPQSKVKVYVVSTDFQENELPYLLAPLATWNAAADATGAKVTFEYQGTVTKPRYGQNFLNIVRGLVFNKSERHLTELRAYSAARNQVLTWAVIVVDPRLTNPKALGNAMAHELGHSFGLFDCYSCKQKSTVMVQFDSINAPNEMNGPSACDVAQVKAVYRAVVAQLKRLTPPKSVVDEGEEPVDDDTLIVVPKP